MPALDGKLDIIDRILSKNIAWIAAADTKATLTFTVISAMLAVVAALIPPTDAWTIWSGIAIAGAVLFQGTSLVNIVLAMFPQLAGPRGSIVFFGGIASHDEQQYVQKIKNSSVEDLVEDFARQCHRNAEIAQLKFGRVRYAVLSGFISLPFWLAATGLLYPLKYAGGH